MQKRRVKKSKTSRFTCDADMDAVWWLLICSLKAGSNAAQLELSKFIAMAECQTLHSEVVWVTDVAVWPQHPELPNFRPVAKTLSSYLHNNGCF